MAEVKLSMENKIHQYDYYCSMRTNITYSICIKSKLYSCLKKSGLYGHKFIEECNRSKFNYFVCRDYDTIEYIPIHSVTQPKKMKRKPYVEVLETLNGVTKCVKIIGPRHTEVPLIENMTTQIVTKHMCDCFPVMIGSKLDRFFNSTQVDYKVNTEQLKNMTDYEYKIPTITNDKIFDIDCMDDNEQYKRVFENPELLKYIHGSLFIRGQIYYIPFNMINNRLDPHIFSVKNSPNQDLSRIYSYRMFVYDNLNRGYKIDWHKNIPQFDHSSINLRLLVKIIKRNKITTNIGFMQSFKKFINIENDIQVDEYLRYLDDERNINAQPTSEYTNVFNYLQEHIILITSQFICRDYNGKNHNNLNSFKENLRKHAVFNYDLLSINQYNIIEVLKDVQNTYIDIDDFRNKLILDITEILNRIFTLGNPNKNTMKMLENGNFQSIISQKIKFDKHKTVCKRIVSKYDRLNAADSRASAAIIKKPQTKRTDNNIHTNDEVKFTNPGFANDKGYESNFLRKPRANHIMIFPNLLNVVFKPRGKNVKNIKAKDLPEKHDGYLCKYGLGNIGNMGDKASLVYDVITSMCDVKTSINMLIAELIDRKVISQRETEDIDVDSIIINGLPSKYQLNNHIDWMQFIIHCKCINHQTIVKRTNKYIYINFINGTPLKPIFMDRYQRIIYVSPTELNLYFSHVLTMPTFERCGLFAILHQRKFGIYPSFAKQNIATHANQSVMNTAELIPLQNIMSGGSSVFLKNRTHNDNIPKFTDNNFFNCSDKTIVVDPYTGRFKLRTLFCDYGKNTCEDTILLNKKLNFNTINTCYFNIELSISEPIDIIPFKKDECKIFTYYPNGSKKEMLILICRIISSEKIPLYIFSKLSRYEYINKRSKMYEYIIYKYINHHALINLNEEDVKIKITYDHVFEYNEKINIKLILVYKSPIIFGAKLCNNDGQKGICIPIDMSRIRDINGEEPDVIYGCYSVPGREPMQQLKQMASERMPDLVFYSLDNKVLEDKGFNGMAEYYMLCNNTFDTKNDNTQMRLDQNSTFNWITNGLSNTHYRVIQSGMKPAEQYELLPLSNMENFELLQLQKTMFHFPYKKFGYDNKKQYDALMTVWLEYINFCETNKCFH